MTSLTNNEGIANVSFRIPTPDGRPAQAIFGKWKVEAVVDIAGVSVSDRLTFRVGWIIELIKIETVDENNVTTLRVVRKRKSDAN